MKTVSAEYKNTMQMTMRPPSQFEGVIRVSEKDINNDKILTNPPASTKFSTSIFEEPRCEYVEFSFDNDYFRVGTKQIIIPTTKKPIANGFVSERISDDNGEFSPPIVFHFDLPKASTIPSFQIRSPNIDSAPDVSRISFFSNGTKKYSENLRFRGTLPHAEPQTQPGPQQKFPLTQITHVTLEVSAIKRANSRLKISYVNFGEEFEINMENLISSNEKITVDPISSSLSKNEIVVKVENVKRKINPLVDENIWHRFETNQRMTAKYGVVTNEKTNRKEWLDAGVFYLKEKPSLDKNTITFNLTDTLGSLNGVYKKAKLYSDEDFYEAVSLEFLAIDVLTDAGISNYEIPPIMRELKTSGLLPQVTHRECLQIIANAAGCAVFSTPNGAIVFKEQKSLIEYTPDMLQDYIINEKILFDDPMIKIENKTNAIETPLHYISVAERFTPFFEADVRLDNNGVGSIAISHPPMDSVQVVNISSSGNAEIPTEIKTFETYARNTVVEFSGEPKATVFFELTGKAITESSSSTSTVLGENEKKCKVDNPLCTSSTIARNILRHTGAFLKKGQVLSAPIRQDFRLDGNDIIRVDTTTKTDIPCLVTKLEYNIPGQKGSFEARRLDVGV